MIHYPEYRSFIDQTKHLNFDMPRLQTETNVYFQNEYANFYMSVSKTENHFGLYLKENSDIYIIKPF